MLVIFELENGKGTVAVESTELDSNDRLKRATVSEKISKASKTFEEALQAVRPAAIAVRAALSDLGPKETEVSFGLKLSADSGAIIARAGAEANFNVTLKWSE